MPTKKMAAKKNDALMNATAVLDTYLQLSNRRKTPERYAILRAAYSIKGHFSLEKLAEQMSEEKFYVSRSTLYNTMRLFAQLRIIVCHRLSDGTKYEAVFQNENHCHQICTQCGKVTELNVPSITNAVRNAKFKRFHQDTFAVYVYGICSSCLTKRSKKEKQTNVTKTINSKRNT